MCVGVPAKVINIEEERALVDVMGAKMIVGILFVPDVTLNQYVLIHAGQAMAIIDEEDANESMKEWRDLLDVIDRDLL
ncbi:HypC/HybG/HupF family hydrogenase formation chaperone [Salipaludibacillus keqinensis]|uniref:HypC/HybG/HupF family hydrogenase formation chaperone n=1 Tax=Salipaludibacillus keqinensis TaxID=2045207 RepID=A0A323TJ11_9BACI|nr:HypC/HybG/HupF family hydrogenase formation chaperone [Salipaludibacillus keqinensis]PYZ94808.1 HypC/HybG/HupF family hydrogenase formation chaperone [Salipaludibacillus keqinensis]